MFVVEETLPLHVMSQAEGLLLSEKPGGIRDTSSNDTRKSLRSSTAHSPKLNPNPDSNRPGNGKGECDRDTKGHEASEEVERMAAILMQGLTEEDRLNPEWMKALIEYYDQAEREMLGEFCQVLSRFWLSYSS